MNIELCDDDVVTNLVCVVSDVLKVSRHCNPSTGKVTMCQLLP